MTDQIVFENVSKFYGEVLGVNRVSLNLAPGITTLVGPNGSGKTTLMNLMTGLVQPSSGRISVLGIEPGDAYAFFRAVGYCTQFDSFPRGLTGWDFLIDSLLLYGISKMDAARFAGEAIERVCVRAESCQKYERSAAAAPIEHLEVDATLDRHHFRDRSGRLSVKQGRSRRCEQQKPRRHS